MSAFDLPGNGRIEPDAGADLALVDLERERVLGAGDLFYRHGQSPLRGVRSGGRVVRALVRGSEVFGGGKAVSGPVRRLARPVD